MARPSAIGWSNDSASYIRPRIATRRSHGGQGRYCRLQPEAVCRCCSSGRSTTTRRWSSGSSRTIRDTAGHLPALAFLRHAAGERARLARSQRGRRLAALCLGAGHSGHERSPRQAGRSGAATVDDRAQGSSAASLRRQNRAQQVIYHDGSSHFWKEQDRRLRPRGRGGAGRAARLAAGGDLYRRLSLQRRRPATIGRSRCCSTPTAANCSTTTARLAARHLAPGAKALRRVDRASWNRSSRSSTVRSGLSHPADARLFPDEAARGPAKAAGRDRQAISTRRTAGARIVAAQLAISCLENQLLEPAVEYFKEAIKRREEALNKQTTGDRTLAQYYIDRAYAYAGLKNTKAAVDDACSAASSFGVPPATACIGAARESTRTRASSVHPLDVLKEVLAASPDLDAYVAELDKKVAAEQRGPADRPQVAGRGLFRAQGVRQGPDSAQAGRGAVARPMARSTPNWSSATTP